MSKETCETCRFWENLDRTFQVCSRFPPMGRASNTMSLKDCWPLTAKNDWCGEWKPKEPRKCATEVYQNPDAWRTTVKEVLDGYPSYSEQVIHDLQKQINVLNKALGNLHDEVVSLQDEQARLSGAVHGSIEPEISMIKLKMEP